MKFGKETETKNVTLKDIVAGNDNSEDKNDNEKKAESNSEPMIKEDEKEPPDTVAEKDKTNENHQEDGETEEFIIDLIFLPNIKQSRRHRYVKYGENLYRFFGTDKTRCGHIVTDQTLTAE